MVRMNRPNRVAIVTGGGQGIGAAIAKRMGASGVAVAVLDRDSANAKGISDGLEADGLSAMSLACDVTDEDEVSRAVAAVAERLGAPTILVNNAGVTRDNLLHKMAVDDWDAVQDVHLRGAFLMTRAAQTHMVDVGWGRIVNMSSVSALGNRGQANYAAAKAGLQGFTKAVAIELGRFGITCNAIAPGFIETDMTARTAARLGVPFDDFKAAVAADIPVGRVGTPEDVANVANFLVDEASGFISGQVVYVAGGPRD
jgi:3-oxoacyl-[acyl-carrier protein] reductase